MPLVEISRAEFDEAYKQLQVRLLLSLSVYVCVRYAYVNERKMIGFMANRVPPCVCVRWSSPV